MANAGGSRDALTSMTPRALCGFSGLAVGLFVALFLTGGAGSFDFWWWMAANAVILVTAGWMLDPGLRAESRRDLRERPLAKIAGGLLSAIVLYGVFWAGNAVLRAWIGGAAGEGIDRVYDYKAGASALRIALTIGLLIGPMEEIVWRGILQRNLGDRLGPRTAFAVATAIYAGVHLASGNPLLVLAALVCGLFWGWMYLRWRSVLLNVVSHTIWDIAVFLVFPFT